jgi:hypothetical protein
VRLDPIFAATVNTATKYHVFLTPRSAETKGLAVVEQNARGSLSKRRMAGRAAMSLTTELWRRCEAKEDTRLESFTLPTRPDTAQGSLPRGSAGGGGGDFCAAVRRGDARWTGHEQRSLIISGEPILPPFIGGLFRATARSSWGITRRVMVGRGIELLM